MKKIAFIGGTGAENSFLLKDVTEHIIETPYGEAKYEAGFFEGREIIHLSRHGAHHTIPPHKINYRANMFALKMLDVAAVISTTAVGSGGSSIVMSASSTISASSMIVGATITGVC